MKSEEISQYGKIWKFINQLIEQITDGQQVETNKIELKRQWYDFGAKSQRKLAESEFAKDIAAIANTVGLTGYLIIGIDEEKRTLYDSPFTNCGLSDISDIRHLIVKTVDKPIDFDFIEVTVEDEQVKKIISVFEIPPSLDKPHVIKSFKPNEKAEINNYIPVRKGTSINPANRSDIELMYYDRKNIEPEYALEMECPGRKFSFSSGNDYLSLQIPLCFTNFGRKPMAIVSVKLLFSNIVCQSHKNQFEMDLERFSYSGNREEIIITPIIIPSNMVLAVNAWFKAHYIIGLLSELRDYLNKQANSYRMQLEAVDIHEKKYAKILK